VLATATPILTILTCATEAAEQRRVCLLELSLLGTGGGLLCEASPPARVVTDTACKAYAPIRYSRKDTPETIAQAREHNAAWDALCKGK
jgi:hypothetical protein